MTYEQSLKNIETLKSLVMPLDTHQVFFDFSNNTEFKIRFFEHKKSKEVIADLMRSKFNSKLPIARIQIHLDQEMFYYEDYVFRYKYNLATQEVIINDQKKGFKNQSSAELAIEMNKLLLKLKNM